MPASFWQTNTITSWIIIIIIIINVKIIVTLSQKNAAGALYNGFATGNGFHSLVGKKVTKLSNAMNKSTAVMYVQH